MKTSFYRQMPDSVPGALCISRGAPRGRRYKRYWDLAPGKWFRTAPIDEYIGLYNEQLSKLDPDKVWKEIHAKFEPGVEPILLCYEPPQDFCHRRLAAMWFKNSLGKVVKECKFSDGQIVDVEATWENDNVSKYQGIEPVYPASKQLDIL